MKQFVTTIQGINENEKLEVIKTTNSGAYLLTKTGMRFFPKSFYC